MAKYSLIDAPIEAYADDCLGIGAYVDAMHSFVQGCETPLTIGVQGDWGIGKTSFLKMLIDQLERGGGCHTIYFNSWQYAQFGQDQSLSLSILRGIVADLTRLIEAGGTTYAGKARESAITFGTFVLNLGAQVFEAQTGANFQKAAGKSIGAKPQDLVAMIAEAKKKFAELVGSITSGDRVESNGRPRKLVIVIDDLDRLKPIRALEFLEAVKNFLDVPGCVFLLAVDYAVIQRGMEEKLGSTAQELQGKSYFDKIIQVPFNMPTGAFQTDRYVMELLGWKKEKKRWTKREGGDFYLHCGKSMPNSDDVRFLTQMTRLTVGTNPRSIKRSINYATLLKLIFINAKGARAFGLQEAKLLYALASLQLAWPEVFQHLAENPAGTTISRLQDFEVLQSMPGFERLLARVHNPEDVKSRIVAFFNELLLALDTNDDGALTREEFQVIPDLLRGANLMSAEATDLDGAWHQFKEMICEATGTPAVHSDVADALDLFRDARSHWHDRLRLRLVPAGSRLMNVLWSSRQIGSLVTTQKEPFQFYLKVDPDALENALGKQVPGVVRDVRGVGHWGTGNTKIDLVALTRAGPSRIEILNQIHEFVLSSKGREHGVG